jgi:hypothetical protein
MTTYSVYIYPNIPREQLGSNNPYIERLKKALQQNGLAVDPSASGNAFADFLKQGIRSDMVILNWLEDLPSRRMGLLQSFVLMTYIFVLKIKGVKIIWIKHNKVSHTQKWFRVRKMIQRLLSRHADHILLHAMDEESSRSGKAIFFPHPCNITPDAIQVPGKEEQPDIDFLIWGSILPYKGILEFLQFVKKDGFLNSLTIHIAGKCEPGYWKQLQEYGGNNIHLVNKFVSEDEIQLLFKRTRFILFTYNKRSVLSSGVLMDSLVACKKMIAPDCGAFKDMAQRQQFVSLFSDFSGIGDIYRQFYDEYNLDYDQVCEFVARNSWYELGSRIKELTGLVPIPPPNSITVEYPKSYTLNS